MMVPTRLEHAAFRLDKTEWVIKNGQHRDTGNIGNTRHKTKTNKTKKHNTEKTEKVSNTDCTKRKGVNLVKSPRIILYQILNSYFLLLLVVFCFSSYVGKF